MTGPDDDAGGDGVRCLRLGGQRLRILSEGTPTHDVAIVDTELPPGSGAPRHLHRSHEEAFIVTEGTVRFELDDTVLDAGPGAMAFAPRGHAHGFANVSDAPARMLAVYGPASSLAYLEELARLVDAGATDAESMAAFYERYDSEPA